MSRVLPKGQTSLLSFFQQQKRGGDGDQAATTTTTTGTRTPSSQRNSTRVTPEDSSSPSLQHPAPAHDLSELLLSQEGIRRRREEAVPASPLREDAEETASTSKTINHEQLSDYELLRLRNIQRNEARLAALGLLPSSVSSRSSTTTTRTVRPKRRAPAAAPSTAAAAAARSLPTRRSTRQRGSSRTTLVNSTTTSSSGGAATATEDPSTQFPAQVEPEIISYQVSPLMQYSMVRTPCPATNTASTTSTTNSSTSWTSLTPLAQRLDPGMGAVYSLHFSQNSRWLVGAGKAGCIALWDVTTDASKHCDNSSNKNNHSVVDPLWTWKAHAGRWIAEARFLTSMSTTTTTGSTSNSSPPQEHFHLVTAGNDGTVCLWDLTSRQMRPNGLPRLLAQSNKHNLHSSGIFAMDTMRQGRQGEYHIATASKDKTIRISRIGTGGSSNPQWNEWTSHHHTRKVGDVRFATTSTTTSTLLASAGDDGIVAIHDTRTHRIVGELQQAHIRPHSVVWRPPPSQSQSSPPYLLTAGYDDPTLKLWDLRKLGGSTPLAVLEGHVPAAGTTTTRGQPRIHRPVFYGAGGEYVLTGGSNSRALSMYHISPSHQVTLQSRGVLPEECGDAACLAVMEQEHESSSRCLPQKVALSTERAEILLLEPTNSSAAAS